MVPLKPLIGGLAMAALTALASVVAPSGAAATSVNYLTNGSFEESSGAPDYNHFVGWTESGNFAPYTFALSGHFDEYPGAENGHFYAVVGPVGPDNSLSSGSLSQTFADVVGQSLDVTGWYAAVGDRPSDLTVSFGPSGGTLTELLNLCDPNTNGKWTEFSFDVIASGLDTFELSFADNPGWIALDNFSVTDPPTAAPLPGALPLFAGGLGMMGLFGWLRKKQAVTTAA
jgi:hypothetical protein